MNAAVIVIHSLLSVVVIFLILVHSGRDSGLSGAFGVGAAPGAHGGSTAIVEKNLDRLTVAAGILFFITTIFLAKRL